MPQLTVTWRHGVAALAGAALAASGLFLGGGFESAGASAPPVAPDVTATTSLSSVPIIAEDEALIGNTVLVPLSLRTVGNAVVFDYMLTGLGGPTLTAMPERFVLTTADGAEYTGTVSSQEARSVRFEGAADAIVRDIAVTGWRQRMYEDYETTLSLIDGATLNDGTILEVTRVLDETVGALVYFDVTTGANRGFGIRQFMGPVIIISGDGWQDVLNVHTGGSPNFGTPSLSVTIEPLPDEVPIRVVAQPWVEMEETIVVYEDPASA
jgi:hypothetical protein